MRIDGKELFEAVTQVNRVISNRATLPVLSGIRLTQKSGGLEVAAPSSFPPPTEGDAMGDKPDPQLMIAASALEIVPQGQNETIHWTSAKEVEAALSNAVIEDQKVMLAVPYKRVLKPKYLPKPVVLEAVGIYPIVAIQELETEDGQKVLAFIGSEEVGPIGPIQKRRADNA